MSKAYIIDPYMLDSREVEMTPERFAEMAAFLAKGTDTALVTPVTGGDAILSSSTHAASETPVKWALRTIEEIDPNAQGFSGDEADVVMVAGMGLVVGAKQEDGTYADPVHPLEWYNDRVGFNPKTASPLAMLKMMLGGAVNASVDRDGITDEQLMECGCDGCQEELAERQGTSTTRAKPLPKSANGATLH